MESCPSNNDANDIEDANDIVGPEGLLTKYFLGAPVSGIIGALGAGAAAAGGALAGMAGGIGAILGLTSLGGGHSGNECTNMPCPSGHFATPECNKCVPCPQNMYQPRAGGNFCMACPKEMYQPLQGQSYCLPCTRASSAAPTCRGTIQRIKAKILVKM